MKATPTRRGAVMAVFAALILFTLVNVALVLHRPEPDLVYVPPAPIAAYVEAVSAVDSLRTYGDGRWVRSFRGPDGTIYLRDRVMSRDGGFTLEPQTGVDVEPLNIKPERVVLVDGDLVYGSNGRLQMVTAGVYRIPTWTSHDGLETIVADSATVYVPEGTAYVRRPHEWHGMWVFGNIVEARDGAWLMTMYGNFESDTLEPLHLKPGAAVIAQQRSFLVRSEDEGRTWRYLSTIAAPKPGDPVGEGFVEPTMVRLDDGRLLAVMRTGHHFPLYASWSEDDGATWSEPTWTGLGHGCDPSLIKLSDGRVALAWGNRFPPGWSRIGERHDAERFEYPGTGTVNLALSSDGGRTWTSQPIAQNAGSCYATILEV